MFSGVVYLYMLTCMVTDCFARICVELLLGHIKIIRFSSSLFLIFNAGCGYLLFIVQLAG